MLSKLNTSLKVLAVTAALFGATATSAISKTVDYKDGMIVSALEKGETVLVEFAADWCGVCRAQQSVMRDLKAANPAYAENIKFIRVNWDQYRGSELATKFGARSQSTLVLAKGDKILGSLTYDSSQQNIKNLLDLAL